MFGFSGLMLHEVTIFLKLFLIYLFKIKLIKVKKVNEL